MTAVEIEEFCRLLTGYQWQDIKHNHFWHCEFCGACFDEIFPNIKTISSMHTDKPTRVSKTNFTCFAHFDPPSASGDVRSDTDHKTLYDS